MRNAFADELTKLAKDNKKIFTLSGDIGNRLFDKFKEVDPERFLNCGVAEQNMVSMGAGMAMCGLHPLSYTITSFMTTRCYEQIKVDVCYHNLPFIIVGVGAGLGYAEGGATHQSCEDLAILRVLPNMTVLCPADSNEVRGALRAAFNHKGPVYIRLGKKGEPVVHKEIPDFRIGEWINVREGKDVCVLSIGFMLPFVLQAAELLEKKKISCKVVSAHTIKPLDDKTLKEAFAKFKLVIVVEEHNIIGGGSAAVAEWAVDHDVLKKTKLLRITAPDAFSCVTCSQEYARMLYGLTPEAIAEKIIKALPKR
ncbi:transketolase [Candidatus Woesearchaeota archaeon]|nr:transketolase [Candidatus Woesearchaeota archaeon]